MGYIQSMADKVWMTVGKTEKVYPVTVEKYRVQGKKIVFDSMDRGRTLLDDEGNKKFQLMNEGQAEGMVKYEDFQETTGTDDFVSVVMVNRDKFAPLNKDVNLDPETYMSKEEIEKFDIDTNALEYTLSVSSFLDWADQHIEQSWKITETSSDKWWQKDTFQAAILFVSAGLFFIFLAYGQGQLFIQEQTEAMQQLSSQIGSLQESVNALG